MIAYIDNILNSIPMYRLVLCVLCFIVVISLGFSLFDIIPFSFTSVIILLITILCVSYVSHNVLQLIFKSVTNNESYLITALILFLVLAPINDTRDLLITIAATIIANLSKYIFVIKRKHIFNPVAISIFLIGLFGFGNGIWWVGSTVLLPFVLISGLLVVRKIRKFYLLWSFLIPAFVVTTIYNFYYQIAFIDGIYQVFTSWPIMFFGTIMLTEPFTMPGKKKETIMYGALVGVLFGLQFSVGPVYASPEFALVIGNVVSYLISRKAQYILTLESKNEIAKDVFEFAFRPDQKVSYEAGQYMEWTIKSNKDDLRGNRRYFTVASAPTEPEVKLGIKIAREKGSTFKSHLLDLAEGQHLMVGNVGGDFVLPANNAKSLVFIAGGIGVTPFRSIIMSLLSSRKKVDIVMFYAANDPAEFAYKDIFLKASKEIGLKVVYVVTTADNMPTEGDYEKGYITHEMLKKYVSNIPNSSYYLSGPNSMVNAYKKLLKSVNVSDSSIVTDFFPGF
jgi:glycine betaine catabolism B